MPGAWRVRGTFQPTRSTQGVRAIAADVVAVVQVMSAWPTDLCDALGLPQPGRERKEKTIAIAPAYARRVCWRGSASRSVSKLLRKIAAAPQSNTASKLVWSINHPTNGEETNGTARQTLRALT